MSDLKDLFTGSSKLQEYKNLKWTDKDGVEWDYPKLVDPSRPIIFEGDDPDSLDKLYLGCEFDMEQWGVLVLLAPPIDELAGIKMTEFTKRQMQLNSKYGYILKIGKRAFEIKMGDKLYQPDKRPHQTGQFVFFDEYHGQTLTVNNRQCYFISDGRLLFSPKDSSQLNVHLISEKHLLAYRRDAKNWLNMTLEERREVAALPAL